MIGMGRTKGQERDERDWNGGNLKRDGKTRNVKNERR